MTQEEAVKLANFIQAYLTASEEQKQAAYQMAMFYLASKLPATPVAPIPSLVRSAKPQPGANN